MSCRKSLDFAPAAGAHLSFYWTMDEAGFGDKVDSTSGLHWPMLASTSTTPALFFNGIEINAKIRGLQLVSSPSIVISQAVSKGISFWCWVKVQAYGTMVAFCCALDDFSTFNNDMELTLQSVDGATTILDLQHNNAVTFAEATSPNLSWTLGSWHMIAGTYDKVAQTLNIYADSVLVASVPDILVYPDLSDSFWALNSANPFAVTIPDFIFDECGLCLNGALTQAQITSLWNGGTGVTWPTVNTIVPFP